MQRRIFKQFLCLLCVSFIPASSWADAGQQQLRDWFERAEQIAHRPNSSEYRFLQKELEGYPLWPYVEQKTLRRYPYISNEKRIARFLEAHADTILDRPLRKKWLTHLAKQNRGDLFLKYYRDIGDTSLQCHKLRFAIDKSNPSKSELDAIEQLWLVGKSQPKECDPLFAMWKGQGRLTEQTVLKRLELAADGGRATLIPYLKTLLPKNKQYLADLWLEVRRSPSKVSRLSKFIGANPDIETDIISYGLRRLIWRNTELALKTWPKAAKRFPFSSGQKQAISARFAIALSSRNHDQAETWLERASSLQQNEELFRWHLAQILREQNWAHVLEIMPNMPAEPDEALAYQYWQARAEQELGMGSTAQASLNQLAKLRHYYGFLASGKQGKPISMVDIPLSPSQQQLVDVANLPPVQRAKEFLALGRTASARREWRYFRESAAKEDMQVAAVLASQWQWHDQAIHTFSDSGYLDDVSKRFPLAFKQDLVANSKRHNILPAWAFAITRRESSFLVDAHSSAGARGLMQLLPSTVSYMEKKKYRNRQLYDPRINVAMGTKYMRYLMDKMDNNPVLVTASYNAGWRRVKDWVPEDEAIPFDIWVETIPFKETRNYVKAVLAYKQIYQKLLGEDENFFAQYANMSIGGNG